MNNGAIFMPNGNIINLDGASTGPLTGLFE
jgi:hypothetical protein